MFADSPKNQDKSKSIEIDQNEKIRMKLLSNGVIASWHLECGQKAENYLNAMDKDDYENSWGFCDPLLQHAMNQNEWERDLQAAKFYLGDIKSRSLRAQRITWDPQGMPEGPYIVIEYDAKSSRTAELSEVITMRRGEDGQWRVLMYQVYAPHLNN